MVKNIPLISYKIVPNVILYQKKSLQLTNSYYSVHDFV